MAKTAKAQSLLSFGWSAPLTGNGSVRIGVYGVEDCNFTSCKPYRKFDGVGGSASIVIV